MTNLINDLNDLVGQFEREKISKKDLLDTLLNIVSYEKKSKAILLKKSEFDFLLDWLNSDLHLELENDDFPSKTVRLHLPKIIKKMERA
mgnify:CR=1 FL=1|tara:strand:+ start:521 stop:787 length:267 start_codon:yes stop_codon:yes gene_type:complete